MTLEISSSQGVMDANEYALAGIFSHLPPSEAANVCSTSKWWKSVWEHNRYQEKIYAINSFPERVRGLTLSECFAAFSPGLAETVEQKDGKYLHLAKTVQMMHAVAKHALAFLSPEERKGIETYPVIEEPQGILAHALVWIKNWLFSEEEVIYRKREVWQIIEDPDLLKALFEKAFSNRDLYIFLKSKIEGNDLPPWEKIERIRQWIQRSSTTVHALDLSGGEVRGNITAIPSEIEAFSGLETLVLFKNRLSALPEGLGKLSSLQTLRLEDNQLTSFLMDCSSLKKLQGLFLEGNLLEDLPSSMGCLPLLTLDISYNPMKHLPQVLFDITSLRLLRICESEKTIFGKELSLLKNYNPALRIEVITTV